MDVLNDEDPAVSKDTSEFGKEREVGIVEETGLAWARKAAVDAVM